MPIRRFIAPSACIVLAVALLAASPAMALEYPIGKPQIRAGMEVSAVYLQPVPMEPAGMMRAVRDSDIHL
jgi:periplasmic iron binding protein